MYNDPFLGFPRLDFVDRFDCICKFEAYLESFVRFIINEKCGENKLNYLIHKTYINETT
jgi:hypothetical protein